MSKHVITVELVVEANTWAQAREKVHNFLWFANYENKQIFHYTIKNGDDAP